MGTFGSFGTVRLGIYAAQKGLDVTGNNITNINTEGYTRQRLNQVSLIPSVCDRYASSYNTRIGQGAVISGVNQIRDPGLDISYRKAVSNMGSANAKLEGLNRLASILDEVGKGSLEQDDGVILSQLNDIRDLISQAIASGGSSTYDSLIRSAADALAKHFKSYAADLSELKTTYENDLKQDVAEVNDILTQIRDLNVSIRDADLRGDPGLELRDNRNLLLDKLSEYMKIDVKYSMEDVGANTYVEKLTITLATGDKHTLVDGKYATTLTSGDEASHYQITLGELTDAKGDVKPGSGEIPLNELQMYGALQSVRDILNGKGEYATNPDTLETALNDNVEAVNDLLDQIAAKTIEINAGVAAGLDVTEATAQRDQLVEGLKDYVAVDVNDGPPYSITLAGTGTSLVDGTGTAHQFTVQETAGKYSLQVDGTDTDPGAGMLGSVLDAANSPADTALDPNAATKRGIPYYQMMLDNLAYQFAKEMNELNNTGLDGSGNLFSVGSHTDDATGVDPVTGEPIRITASNISISKSWDAQSVSIQYTSDSNAPSGDTSNMARFLDLFSKKLDFKPGDINAGAAGDPFHGSFEDMLLKIQSTLAEDQRSTDSILNNYVITADDLYVDREGVMGVDLNDEATNLMTYQKAYTAACRLLTVLEEALDSLINGTI